MLLKLFKKLTKSSEKYEIDDIKFYSLPNFNRYKEVRVAYRNSFQLSNDLENKRNILLRELEGYQLHPMMTNSRNEELSRINVEILGTVSEYSAHRNSMENIILKDVVEKNAEDQNKQSDFAIKLASFSLLIAVISFVFSAFFSYLDYKSSNDWQLEEIQVLKNIEQNIKKN